jgi:hypothetical protein
MIARLMTNEQYVTRIPGKASIGEHLRHCVEHFSLFFEGLNTGVIDYDARKRDIELESSTSTFIATIRNIATQLKSLDETAMTKLVTVRTLFVPYASPIEVASTLSRELAFLSSHSIHHIAIVKMIAHAQGISLPDEYGLSHATISHRKNYAKTSSGT